jgi:hypothetical protein
MITYQNSCFSVHILWSSTVEVVKTFPCNNHFLWLKANETLRPPISGGGGGGGFDVYPLIIRSVYCVSSCKWDIKSILHTIGVDSGGLHLKPRPWNPYHEFRQSYYCRIRVRSWMRGGRPAKTHTDLQSSLCCQIIASTFLSHYLNYDFRQMEEHSSYAM